MNASTERRRAFPAPPSESPRGLVIELRRVTDNLGAALSVFSLPPAAGTGDGVFAAFPAAVSLAGLSFFAAPSPASLIVARLLVTAWSAVGSAWPPPPPLSSSSMALLGRIPSSRRIA